MRTSNWDKHLTASSHIWKLQKHGVRGEVEGEWEREVEGEWEREIEGEWGREIEGEEQE